MERTESRRDRRGGGDNLLRRDQRVAVALLIAIPLLVFVPAAIFGAPAIAGDNLTQNFPLRVLAGAELRSGHLPLWNPFLWSGTPLLGGMNAGALYPFEILFVFLTGIPAWTATLVITYWICGLSMYALCRDLTLRPSAAFMGAMTFTFLGTMNAQIVHFPIIEGLSWIPLIVLAQLRLVRLAVTEREASPRSLGARPLTWLLIMAAAIGCVMLTGEPRAIAEVEIVVGIVMLFQLTVGLANRTRRLATTFAAVGSVLVGIVWGIALGAVQLLPGWKFISQSQRAAVSYEFFGSGSLPVRWSALEVIPQLFGATNNFGIPEFFSSYNQAEVVGYIGLLAICAIAAMTIVEFSDRRAPLHRTTALFLTITAVGLLMAWGRYTPLGHLFNLIPLFGKTRLQSRNLIAFDFGAAVVGAIFFDRLVAVGRRGLGLIRWRFALVVAPLVATMALAVAVAIFPTPIERWFGSGSNSYLGDYLKPMLIIQFVLSGLFIWVLWRFDRGPRPRRSRQLGCLVALDGLIFVATCTAGVIPGNVTFQTTPDAGQAVFTSIGRFAIFDPLQRHLDDLTAVGETDLNTSTRLESIQGYGSLVGYNYGYITGAHLQGTFDPCALASGTFDQLNLHRLLTGNEYLAPPVTSTVPSRVARVIRTAPLCVNAPAPGAHGSRTFYFGTTLALDRINLIANAHLDPSSLAHTAIAVSYVDPAGIAHPGEAKVVRASDGWHVTFPTKPSAVGFTVSGGAQLISNKSTVTDQRGVTYQLNGVLQDALGETSWSYVGQYGHLSVFDHGVKSRVYFAQHEAGNRAIQVSRTLTGTEVDKVATTHGGVLLRPVAYLDGWQARATDAGGHSFSLPISQRSLIQSVTVPPGEYLITFTYVGQGVRTGLVISLVALGALVTAALVVLIQHGSRRRRLEG